MDSYEIRDALSSEAFVAGRHSGKQGAAASINPHPVGSFEYIEWEKGRRSIELERAATSPVRFPCNYVRGASCDEHCDRRGLCLDVA